MRPDSRKEELHRLSFQPPVVREEVARETERRADKDRSVVERFELVESNQAKILGLLGKITDRGDQDHHRER